MHFPDKHAMLMEIGGNALGRLAAEASAIAAQPADAAERVRAVLAAHMSFALTNQTAYRIVFCEGSRDPQRSEAAPDVGGVYYQVLADIVGELASAGRLLTGPAPVVARALFTACHGLVSELILNPMPDDPPAGALTTATLDGLVRGHIAAKAA